MDNQYCVYNHVDSDGIVRYIGSGRIERAKRVNAESSRGAKYKDFVLENGRLRVIIVKDGLTKEESILLEQELYDKQNSEYLLNTKRPNYNIDTKDINFSEYLYYDEDSPSFLRWKVKVSQRSNANNIAGSLNKITGYSELMLKGRVYKCHRVVFELINGKFDKNLVIDHIDGNRSNNNINNLRLCSNAENSRNVTFNKNSPLPIGVSLSTGKNQFVATVNHPEIRTKSWQSRRICRYFNIDKYGYSEALRLATEARLDMLSQLEEEFGTVYSEKHK